MARRQGLRHSAARSGPEIKGAALRGSSSPLLCRSVVISGRLAPKCGRAWAHRPVFALRHVMVRPQ